jgi:L-asparaginase
MLLITNYEGRGGILRAITGLKANMNGLLAIVEGIKRVEEDLDIHSVGQSSWPNILGEIELDAAVMDGHTRKTGAVGALRGFKHPVAVAYEVMCRLDHELLVGTGAERFAREIGAVANRNETEFTVQAWRAYLDARLTADQKQRFPDLRLLDLPTTASDPERLSGRLSDTTVYLCIDHEHRISTATSTSGWAWKYPGRLGDSPLIGAGSYADSRYGACACTHTGEMTIRAGTARVVVQLLKMGYGLRAAVHAAAQDLADLTTGAIGTVTIHAIDAAGGYCVMTVNATTPVQYLVWHDTLPHPEVKEAESFAVA